MKEGMVQYTPEYQQKKLRKGRCVKCRRGKHRECSGGSGVMMICTCGCLGSIQKSRQRRKVK